MQEGRASQTAVMVCMGRAIAHLEGSVPGFSDAVIARRLSPRAWKATRMLKHVRVVVAERALS